MFQLLKSYLRKYLKQGDILVLYRTGERENGKSAEYSSVASSICVVEDVKTQNEFKDFEQFYNYASKYSVFDKENLHYWYKRGYCKAIKMTYNFAFKKSLVNSGVFLCLLPKAFRIFN